MEIAIFEPHEKTFKKCTSLLFPGLDCLCFCQLISSHIILFAQTSEISWDEQNEMGF